MHIEEYNIGDTIRIFRVERGLSREELAEQTGISCSHMNKIEAGIKQPGINTYKKIMSALEVDIVIREEEKTEKGKYVAKAKEILMGRTENEVKYLVRILECASKNLHIVNG